MTSRLLLFPCLFTAFMIMTAFGHKVSAQELPAAESPLLNNPMTSPRDNIPPADDIIEDDTTRQLTPQTHAVLRTLDKVTGRTGVATLRVDEVVKLGTLYLTVKSCRKAAPIEQPESAAFIQVWSASNTSKKKDESQWVFSGWMFASSPSLSAMDHAVYDISVLDCKNKSTPVSEQSTAPNDTDS